MEDKYIQIVDGEWIEIPFKGFSMECCNCSLVHTLNFKVEDGRLFIKSKQDKKSTKQRRNLKNISYQIHSL